MFEIIHQGTLTMWRQRVNLDLWIVNHAAAQTIEIVAFRADTNKEARLYVDKLAILRKIDYQELDHTIAEEKEAHLRQHKTFVAENFVKSFEDDHIVNFIRKRLSIPANLPSDAFQLELKVLFGDRVRERAARANSFAEAGRMDTAGGGQVLEGLLDSPPTSLAPYRAKLQPKLDAQEVMSAIDLFSSEQHALAKFTHVVSKIVTKTVASLPSPSADPLLISSPPASARNRVRGSVLLRSIDDNFIMECTNFWTATQTPAINDMLLQSAKKPTASVKLDPIERKDTHDNHIPGLKLLKKVGSFKFSGDMEHAYGQVMVEQVQSLAAPSEEPRGPKEAKPIERKPSSAVMSGTKDRLHYLQDTKSSKKKTVRMHKSSAMADSSLQRKKSHGMFLRPPAAGVRATTAGRPNAASAAASAADPATHSDPREDSTGSPPGDLPSDAPSTGDPIAPLPGAAPPSPPAAEPIPSTKQKVLTRMRTRMLSHQDPSSCPGSAGSTSPSLHTTSSDSSSSFQRKISQIPQLSHQYQHGSTAKC